jgi:DMSO/TMAO reductase YedYZ molybdopterin-dependent catalytic subunit
MMFYGAYNTTSTAFGGIESPLVEAWPIHFEGALLPEEVSRLQQWSVSVEGLVAKPCTLSVAQLLLMPQSIQVRRVVSQQGWSYKTEWRGIPLKALLPLVSPQAEAAYVVASNARGQSRYWSLAEAVAEEVMLVLGQGVSPLSVWRGGPLRLVAFHGWAETGVSQLSGLSFVSKLPAGVKDATLKASQQIKPCKVYCYDLKTIKSIDKAGEVKGF